MSAEQHIGDILDQEDQVMPQLEAVKAQSVPVKPDLAIAEQALNDAKFAREHSDAHVENIGVDLTRKNEEILTNQHLQVEIYKTRLSLEARIKSMGLGEKIGNIWDNIKNRRKLNSSDAAVERITTQFWNERRDALAKTIPNENPDKATIVDAVIEKARADVENNGEGIRAEHDRLTAQYDELLTEQLRLFLELEHARTAELDASRKLDEASDANEEVAQHEERLNELLQQVDQLESQKQAWAERFRAEIADDLAEIQSLTKIEEKKDVKNRTSAADEQMKPESSLEVTAGQQVTEAAKVRFDDEGNPRTSEAVVHGLVDQMGRALVEYRTIADVAGEDEINYKLWMDMDSQIIHGEMTDLATAKLAELRTQYGAFTAEEMVSARKVEEARLREELGLNKKFNPDDPEIYSMKRNVLKEQERAEKKVQAGLKKFEAAQAERMAKAEQAFGQWLNTEYVNTLHEKALEGISQFHEKVEQTKSLGALDRRLVTSGEYVDALRDTEAALENLEKWERWMNDPADVINQFAEHEELFMFIEQTDRSAIEDLQQEIQQNEAQIVEIQAQIKKVEDRKGWKPETKASKIRKLQVQVDELTERNKKLKKQISKVTKMTEKARATKDARIAELRQTVLPVEFSGEKVFDDPDTNIAKLYQAVMEGVDNTTITRGTTQVRLDNFADRYVGMVPFDTLVQREVIRLREKRDADFEAIGREIAAERTYAELMHATELTGTQVDDLLMKTDESVLSEMSEELASQIIDSSLGRLLKNLQSAQEAYETSHTEDNRRIVEKRLAVLNTLSEVSNNPLVRAIVSEQTKKMAEAPTEPETVEPENAYINAMTSEQPERPIEPVADPVVESVAEPVVEPTVEPNAAEPAEGIDQVIQSLAQ